VEMAATSNNNGAVGSASSNNSLVLIWRVWIHNEFCCCRRRRKRSQKKATMFLGPKHVARTRPEPRNTVMKELGTTECRQVPGSSQNCTKASLLMSEEEPRAEHAR